MGSDWYKKKPREIEAMYWDGTVANGLEVVKWVAGYGGVASLLESDHPNERPIIQIKTLEGVMDATARYYIVRGIEGEFYPVEFTIFMQSYEHLASPLNKALNQLDVTLKLSIATLENSHQLLARNSIRTLLEDVVHLAREEGRREEKEPQTGGTDESSN